MIVLFAARGVAAATNIACSAAALNDPAVQSGSPPGCTQVDMQFSLIEPVVMRVTDTTDSSTDPSDASVAYNGMGSAGGTGVNSQGLEFFQIGDAAFSGLDSGSAPVEEEWHYTFTIGVTDIGGGQITGAYLALGQLNLINNAMVGNISENICPGTTVYSSGCAGDQVIIFNGDQSFSPVSMAAAQFDIDIFLGPDDDFGVADFEMGFDEATPEPATFALMATALAAISAIHARRRRPPRRS